MNVLKTMLLTSSLFLIPAANAATYQPAATLTYYGGVSGTSGNGAVFASDKYTFGPGDVVDFGTAVVYPDPYDSRYGSCSPQTCMGFYSYKFYFLEDGVGGLTPPVFTIEGTSGFTYCAPPSGIFCDPAVLALVVTIPDDKNGVQVAFMGGYGTHLVPVIHNPIPAALPLFATGLVTLAWLARRRVVKTSLAYAQASDMASTRRA